MAASKTYFARPSYRFLSTNQTAPITSDSVFELDESDVWNSSLPELRKPVPSSRLSRKPASSRGGRTEAGASPASLPVNVPYCSKILKEDYEERRRGGDDDFDDGDERIPPHEFLARQLARTRIASFSLHEGVGRTLKGRDLSRVRNAIWEKTGFQD